MFKKIQHMIAVNNSYNKINSTLLKIRGIGLDRYNSLHVDVLVALGLGVDAEDACLLYWKILKRHVVTNGTEFEKKQSIEIAEGIFKDITKSCYSDPKATFALYDKRYPIV